jgi:hemolysin activation/secretion protein
MKLRIPARLLGALLLTALAGQAAGADQLFDIVRFEVEGNTLLPPARIDAIVAPLAGRGRVYGDIQKALEALELAYRTAGFGTVRVHVPEQELSSGVVRITVTESVLGRITVSGNRHFDTPNVLAALAPLRVGQAPDLNALSAAIQLSNDNPAKQLEVVLAAGDGDDRVDAQVALTEYDPRRLFVTLDNSGSATSGKWRLGAAFQHANLFNRDHVGTLAYTTSPDSPDGVRVALFSVGYRIPLYALGDSVDILYGSSSVNTPAVTPTLGSALGIVGKGDVLGLRWNRLLLRRGDLSGKLVFGFDRKYINSRCDVNGAPVSFAPPTPPIASCVPYRTRPLSLTYVGQRQRAGEIIDFSVGVARNWALGDAYTNLDGRSDRYSYLTPGNRRSSDEFVVLRTAATYFKGWRNDWQLRLAGNAQYAGSALVSAEQFGLAGAAAVRGFDERALAADSGLTVNAELYTPDLAPGLGLPGSLRALLYYDAGHGHNRDGGAGATPLTINLASAGAGLRYGFGRDVSARLDLARVGSTGGAANVSRGDWRAHFAMTLGF